MYSAFKSAQISMNEILLKLTEDTLKVSSPAGPPGADSLENFRAGLAELRLQQDRQFATLTNAIQDLNSRIIEITTAHAKEITTSALIPELQRPQVQSNFLSMIESNNSLIDIDEDDNAEAEVEVEEDAEAEAEEEVVEEAEEEVEEAEEAEVEVEAEEVEAEEEVVEEAEEEVEVVEDAEAEVEVEAEVEEVEVEAEVEVVEEEAEAEVEVEEWTYKGMALFKDSNNMVYANVDGEVGDQIGIYNPVKGTVKKI